MNYKCMVCGRKSPTKKCRSCGSLDMIPHKPDNPRPRKTIIVDPDVTGTPAISVIDSSPTPPIQIENNPGLPPGLPPISTLGTDNIDIYAEIDKTVSELKTDKPIMEIKEKCSLVFGAPFVITNFITDQIDEKSKYKPLANIWHFEETEINEIVDYIFSILEQYWPNVLEKISKIDVVFIIFNGMAIFMIFGKKIIQTIKFFKDQEEKKLQEKLVNDARTAPVPNRPTA